MDSWKVDLRQRLIDHVVVYSEVQFQRAGMKARGLTQEKEKSLQASITSIKSD